MKYLVIVILFALGCTEKEVTQSPVAVEPTKPVEIPAVKPETQKKPLAWGNSHADWDKYLYDAISGAPSLDKVTNICKTLSHKDCLAQSLSIMSKYESRFKPSTFYAECNKDKCVYSDGCNKVEGYGYCMKGNSKYDNGVVISSGLLQISTSSAISYGCNVKSKEDLTDPKKNLECAVKIASKWIVQDGVFYKDGTKLGLARYWSVMRDSSKSKHKILDYMKQF